MFEEWKQEVENLLTRHTGETLAEAGISDNRLNTLFQQNVDPSEAFETLFFENVTQENPGFLEEEDLAFLK